MKKMTVCASAVLLGCLIFSGTASAYALGNTAPAGTITSTLSGYAQQAQQLMSGTAPLPAAPSWFSDLLSSVNEWFQSVMAEGTQSNGTLIVLPAPFTNLTSFAQNLFGQFDAWLYSIVHFHITFIINFMFGLVNWILNVARNAVDWLNSIFLSAARR